MHFHSKNRHRVQEQNLPIFIGLTGVVPANNVFFTVL